MIRGSVPSHWMGSALLLLLLLAGCRGTLCDLVERDSVRVDGVRLRHHREVELTAPELSRLAVESQRGDIRLRGMGDASARLEVELYEYRPGDATARLSRDGQILLETSSGKPAAIGEVRGEIPQSLSLELSTGMGAIELRDLRGAAQIAVSTGMGDVSVADCDGLQDLEAGTGMGDLILGPAADLDRVELATGMGGIRVIGAGIRRLAVSSGMGSIRFCDCEFGRVTGGTGMGSVHFRNTEYEHADVSSGMGRVSYEN